VAPPGDYFVPESRIPADYLNDLFQKSLQGSVNAKVELVSIIQYVGQAPFQNFRTAVAITGGANSLLWSPYEGHWYSLGSTDNVRRSNDQGTTWSAASEVSGGTPRNVAKGAVSPSEIVALTLGSRDVYRKSGGSWTKHVNALAVAPTNLTTPRIVYDADSSLFIAAYHNGGTIAIETSPTGVTWTPRSLPGAWAAGHSRHGIVTHGGRTVLVARKDATTTESSVATSDDGGLTWTARTDLTHVDIPNTGAAAVYLDENTYLDVLGGGAEGFMYTAADTVVGGGEVLLSTDGGETFTSKLTYGTGRVLVNPLPFGAAWVAMTGTPAGLFALQFTSEARLLYSLTEGATWLDSGYDVPSTGLQCLVPCEGGFALYTNVGGARMGFRFGAAGREVIA